MPYYCTVPRCTSMAGKAKNVSFHQFPRDEELAQLWNNILKRGKPYTKYSKVCSLHFRPEDYTITSVGKNKGQWRTLRKDAIPSRNLPSESPPSQRRSRTWTPSNSSSPSSGVDPQIQQQIAQLIYLQTMLAMQANNCESSPSSDMPHGSTLSISSMEKMFQKYQQAQNGQETSFNQNEDSEEMTDVSIPQTYNHNSNNTEDEFIQKTSYKCEECSKCFKDPDVYKLHQRMHKKSNGNILNVEKENLNSNNISNHINDKTLKANPILTNLLNNDMQRLPDSLTSNIFDSSKVNAENHIMQTFAANMESYINNLTAILSNKSNGMASDNESNMSDENMEENSPVEAKNTNDSTKISKEISSSEANSDIICQDFKVDIEVEELEEVADVAITNDKVAEGNEVAEDNDNIVEDNDNFVEDNDNIVEDNDKLEEINDEIEESNDKLAEINDEIAESNDKLAEINDEIAESDDKVAEVNDKLAEGNDNVAKGSDTISEFKNKVLDVTVNIDEHSTLENTVLDNKIRGDSVSNDNNISLSKIDLPVISNCDKKDLEFKDLHLNSN